MLKTTIPKVQFCCVLRCFVKIAVFLDAAVVKFEETRGQTRWKYTNSLKGGKQFGKDIEAAAIEVGGSWVPPVTN
jgi:hypothetical protein